MDGLDFTILAAPFIAGVLVLATHVPLGQQVLARGIVFIDLAIAQVAGLGVIAAGLLGFEAHGVAGQLAAVAAALLGALLLTFTEKRWPQVQEALIGVLFVLAVTASVQLVGVYLVFASLIVPALGARPWPQTGRLAVGFAIGLTGYAGGLALSLFSDLPASALIVLLLVLSAACAAALSLVFSGPSPILRENAEVDAAGRS